MADFKHCGMFGAEVANEFLEYYALHLSNTEIQNYKYAIGQRSKANALYCAE